ncbi:hypothetical protein Rhow_008761 [Rhodococcus wratislaviensis]|uniref:Uncharacterized protein n=1 Tax=Rhodococcus wratislaviensis TaxID=44752 RepID=A0A402CL24_RHOWR|nr:hypothetical protein Rhow_008761 [Rhodococcus wratislaviensis]
MQVHRPLRTMEVRDFTRRGFAAINERWCVQRWMVAFERALLLLHVGSTIQFTIENLGQFCKHFRSSILVPLTMRDRVGCDDRPRPGSDGQIAYQGVFLPPVEMADAEWITHGRPQPCYPQPPSQAPRNTPLAERLPLPVVASDQRPHAGRRHGQARRHENPRDHQVFSSR